MFTLFLWLQLALVHMADQYTRVTCGGSPLDKNAPVVGLLFGTRDVGGSLQVMDADDIPTEVNELSTMQVKLHQAVFPQHSVVGWYRVSKDDEPSPSDLQITQQLTEHYAKSESMVDGGAPNEKKDEQFVFCLLQVQQRNSSPSSEEPMNTLSSDLPISLYEIHEVEGSSILLGINRWQLETSEPERISVERVMEEQPQHHSASVATVSSLAKGTASLPTSTYSPFVTRVQTVQQSLQSMKDRIQLLISFLDDTQQGRVPPNHSLLRQVQGLLYALGPLAAVSPENQGGVNGAAEQDAAILSHLAAVAKTVSAVQSYTDKFRLVHENRVMAKEMRRPY